MSTMKSSVDFFKDKLNNIPTLLNEVKQFLEDINLPLKSEDLYIFINILYSICLRDNLIDEYLKPIITQDNVQLIQDIKGKIMGFISEEKDNIINYIRELKKRKKNNYLNLTKMEYKFIGLMTPNDLERGNINPKLLITLYFNDGSEQLIESSFASFKKLQEEIENCLSTFNSSYSRRVQIFAK